MVAQSGDTLAQRSAHRLRHTAREWQERRRWPGAAVRCGSLERGAGAEKSGAPSGSAGPEETTRRRVSALPAARGAGSAPGPRRSRGTELVAGGDPAYLC